MCKASDALSGFESALTLASRVFDIVFCAKILYSVGGSTVAEKITQWMFYSLQ